MASSINNSTENGNVRPRGKEALPSIVIRNPLGDRVVNHELNNPVGLQEVQQSYIQTDDLTNDELYSEPTVKDQREIFLLPNGQFVLHFLTAYFGKQQETSPPPMPETDFSLDQKIPACEIDMAFPVWTEEILPPPFDF